MTRAERLLALLQALRRRRHPVSGHILAQELGISIRTLYRDIASLQAQGADIQGEPGVGYVLRPGFMLPPLMLSHTELEALTLGARWTAKFADQQLVAAAHNALAKISAVLPDNLRYELDSTTLLVGPRELQDAETIDMTQIRLSIRYEQKAQLIYQERTGEHSTQTVWPFALGFFPHTRVLVVWDEARATFRHFATQRILHFELLEERYPLHRTTLLNDWRRQGLDVRQSP